ncbi:MAG: DNA polymerase III subunit chi [Chromatiales bacterium]|nr:DNA polymerase III subunit chi [Chromatiales bacterium]
MPQVDFYILPDGGVDAVETYACRLTEKVAGLGHRVLVVAADPAASARMDERLWTFRPGSFVAHAAWSAEIDPLTPVVIHTGADCQWPHAVAINLAGVTPEALSEIERVAEIVGADPAEREAGRARFSAWRRLGVEPTVHNI